MADDEVKDELPEVTEETLAGSTPDGGDGLGFVMDVPLRLSVEIGSAELLVREVLQLSKGSIVELDRMSGEPVDVFVNERLVAKGEVTVAEERMAVRIVEVLSEDRNR